MSFGNYGFNFQMNLSDKIFSRPGQDLENMLRHGMIENLFMNPGPNCKKFFDQDKMYKLIDYATKVPDEYYGQDQEVTHDEKKFTFTSAKILSLNSSIVGDFFFPPPPPPQVEAVTLSSGKTAIKIESTPYDDIDSDAELDDEEVLRRVAEKKEAIPALNEPESEQMPEDQVNQLQEAGEDGAEEEALEDENRAEDQQGQEKKETGEVSDGSQVEKMNVEPDQDNSPDFEEIKDEDLEPSDGAQKNSDSVLRDSNTERLQYLFKILRTDSPKNSTTVGYFNKIIMNLFHFYPLEIFNFCFEDQTLLENFLNSLQFNKITEVFSKLINFEKRLYFKNKQNDFVRKFDDVRTNLFKSMIRKLEAGNLKPQEGNAVLKVLNDFLSRNNEIIGGDFMLDQVIYNREMLSVVKRCVNQGKKSLAIASCKIIVSIIHFTIEGLKPDEGEDGRDVKQERLNILQEIFDKEFFKNAVELVEAKVSAGGCGIMVNSMGQEVANIGIKNYQILHLISSFLKLDVDQIKDSIAQSGYTRTLIKFFEKFPLKNQLHCIAKNALEIVIGSKKDSLIFKTVTEDKILLEMLYNCSQDNYVYPECRLNKKIDAKIALTEDQAEISQLKKRKIKAGNYGFLREIGNLVDEIDDKDKKSLVTSGDEKWVFFKENYLKKINFLLSEEREDSFRRRKKRSSIYFSNEDSSVIPDILDSIKNSLDKIEQKKNKKSQQKVQKNSFFSTDFGHSDFSVQFKEKKNDIFTDSMGDKEGVSDNSGDEEEEHLKQIGEKKVEGEEEEEEEANTENFQKFEERNQESEIMGEDVD